MRQGLWNVFSAIFVSIWFARRLPGWLTRLYYKVRLKTNPLARLYSELYEIFEGC